MEVPNALTVSIGVTCVVVHALGLLSPIVTLATDRQMWAVTLGSVPFVCLCWLLVGTALAVFVAIRSVVHRLIRAQAEWAERLARIQTNANTNANANVNANAAAAGPA